MPRGRQKMPVDTDTFISVSKLLYKRLSFVDLYLMNLELRVKIKVTVIVRIISSMNRTYNPLITL
jgi:hypothetical protein